MSYDVDEAAEGLENKINVGEVPMTYVKQRKICSMNCAVGNVAEVLEKELWRGWSDVRISEWGGRVVQWAMVYLKRRKVWRMNSNAGEVPMTYVKQRKAVEWAVTYVNRREGWRKNCDVGKAAKSWRLNCDVGEACYGFENEAEKL